MYQYFADDYAADLALNMALDAGANMDEIDRACGHLKSARVLDHEDLSMAYFDAWVGGAERLVKAARSDEEAGRTLSASEKYRRAALMYLTGERLPRHGEPARHAAYDAMLTSFDKFVELGDVNCEKVSVPYGDAAIPGLFVAADRPGPAPALVHFNGLDGVKEYLFLSGFGQALARRGISTLFADNPGVGEAIRKYGLTNAPDSEVPAGACADFLQTRTDVDADRLGMAALSLGGYHAPRATAFEPRFKVCIAWGANYDWGALMRRRVAGQGGEPSVPHAMEHIHWVTGTATTEELLAFTSRFTLQGILDRITVPILIVHGDDDRQIPVSAAHATYEGCVNSPRRELRIFTAAEGGEQHCQIGNMSIGTDYMADFAAEVLCPQGL